MKINVTIYISQLINYWRFDIEKLTSNSTKNSLKLTLQFTYKISQDFVATSKWSNLVSNDVPGRCTRAGAALTATILSRHERTWTGVIYFSQPCVNIYIRRDRDKIHAGKKGRIHRNSGITDRSKTGIHSRAARPQRERDALWRARTRVHSYVRCIINTLAPFRSGM